MYTMTPDGSVRRDDGAVIPDDPKNSDRRELSAWLAVGNTITKTPAAPEAVISDYMRAVQIHLDSVAQAWGYDSVFTAVTYADEPSVKAFADEGKALRAWRSRVWAAARQTLADVKDGKTPAPTVADFLASLPAPPPAVK